MVVIVVVAVVVAAAVIIVAGVIVIVVVLSLFFGVSSATLFLHTSRRDVTGYIVRPCIVFANNRTRV